MNSGISPPLSPVRSSGPPPQPLQQGVSSGLSAAGGSRQPPPVGNSLPGARPPVPPPRGRHAFELWTEEYAESNGLLTRNDAFVEAAGIAHLLTQICRSKPLSFFAEKVRRASNSVMRGFFLTKQSKPSCDIYGKVKNIATTCPDLVVPSAATQELRIELMHMSLICDGRNGSLELEIKREALLSDTIKALGTPVAVSPTDGFMTAKFEGEDGQDAGGVFRDWATGFSEALLRDPTIEQFVTHDNEFLVVNPDFVTRMAIPDPVYIFMGRFLGWVLRSRTQIPLRFPIAYYAFLTGGTVTMEDIQQEDPAKYKSYNYILEMDENKFGDEVEGVQWTLENREQLIAYAISAIPESIRPALELIKNEFLKIAHIQTLPFALTPADLKAAIEGQDIDLEDLIAHTHVNVPMSLKDAGFSEETLMGRLWTVLRRGGQARISKFLLWTTGSKHAPLGGFKVWPHGFKVEVLDKSDARLSSDLYLPIAHTCERSIHLPTYSSEASLEAKLEYAMNEGSNMGLV